MYSSVEKQRVTNSFWVRLRPWCVAAALTVLCASGVQAQKASNIRATKHNLSSTSSNVVKADTAQANPRITSGAKEICVFCHTPHGSTLQDEANTTIAAPLWNRRVKNTTYTGYTSSTLDADIVDANYTGNPAGSSKLCLSCHDGTIAIGNVGVMGGVGFNLSGSTGVDTGVQVSVSGLTTTKMPDAKLTSTVSLTAGSGFTRLLGTNLSNDHPISVSYTTDLATADGEMRTSTPAGTVKIAGSNLSPAGTNLYTRKVFTDAVARNNISGVKPLLPLEPTASDGAGQVQCATCHDPHLEKSGDPYNKFLRGNRLQISSPAGGTFDASKDILCLACHNKAGTTWSGSAHADHAVADETYKNETGTTVASNHNAVGVRDLPTTTKVGETACLACHDVHAVAGSKRLMREGVLGTNTTTTVTGMADTSRNGIYRYKTAAAGAIEETCFMCHRARGDVDNVLALSTQTVPDIKSDFDLWKSRGTNTGASSMPIRSNGTAGNETCNTAETHTIGDLGIAGQATALAGKDFVETPPNLGKLGVGVAQACDINNKRHVECTDCHNPHRVQKGNHAGTNGGTDIRGTAGGNAVSGVLTGTFGVEPTYPAEAGAGSSFGNIPTSFSMRCGVPGGTNNYCADGVVQYEYQICFKCHSNYAYDDVSDAVSGTGAVAPTGTGAQYNYAGRPEMGKGSTTPTGLTLFNGANGVNVFPSAASTRYTNQAMEFWGPTSHRGECSNDSCTGTAPEPSHALSGKYAKGTAAQSDHRSWHPVVFSTGRTFAERGGLSGTTNFRAPFNADVGNQKMYCTDCHGSDNATSTGTNANVPANYTSTGDGAIVRPWGPHGSNKPFILKGEYNTGSFDLCLKCHVGFDSAMSSTGTGFFSSSYSEASGNLHVAHRNKFNGIRCNNCHVAVPHGWKHKALLADTNTVGNEVGFASDGARSFTNAQGYTKGPYYMNSMLKVTNWRRSRQWNSSDCNGGVGGMKSNCQNQ